MRLITNPKQEREQIHSNTLNDLFTEQLLEDLLDPTNTPTQICVIHNLTLTQLNRIINSSIYLRAVEQIETINAARSKTIDSNLNLQAKSVARDITNAALGAAADLDKLKASKDPKLASVHSRLLETARKASATLAYATTPLANAPTKVQRRPDQDQVLDDVLPLKRRHAAALPAHIREQNQRQESPRHLSEHQKDPDPCHPPSQPDPTTRIDQTHPDRHFPPTQNRNEPIRINPPVHRASDKVRRRTHTQGLEHPEPDKHHPQPKPKHRLTQCTHHGRNPLISTIKLSSIHTPSLWKSTRPNIPICPKSDETKAVRTRQKLHPISHFHRINHNAQAFTSEFMFQLKQEREMKINPSIFAMSAALASAASVSNAGVSNIFDEAVLGDFSDDRFAPTFLDFGLGSNLVTTEVIASDIPGIGDRDYYTFSIAAGQSVDSITLVDASNPAGGFDSTAFVGLAFDSIFDFDPDTFNGPGLQGFVLTGEEVVDTDILPELSAGLSSLGEGDYSLWVQQTGDDLTSVTLNFNVVPAPTTGAILATMGFLAARRRR
jgi:hypothetical protein